MEDHEVIVSLVIVRPDFSSSFDVRLHGSSTIPIASFVERGLFIKTFCHRKYLNRRIVYSSGRQGTFNPAVITNKEVHMVHYTALSSRQLKQNRWISGLFIVIKG